MGTSKSVFQKKLIASSISAALLAPALVHAQQDEAMLEEVVVTGMRAALESAVAIKRDANAVVDAISAEDIGKFPDNNVAESLGRIPGVSVSRQFGEGSEVSIRGASNSLTKTTLNGQNVASAGWYSETAINRSFNYSMLPPELISGLKVYKSSQADIVEGGVGGTVVVETRKPLDLDPMTVFASIEGTQSSVSDETDPAASGLFSWQNDSGTFGMLGAVAYSEYSLERRGNEALPVWGGRISGVNFQQERNRTAANLAMQFRPTDSLEFSLDYMNLELEASNVNTANWIPQDTSDCETNADGVPIVCTTDEAFAQSGAGGQTYWDVRPRNATMETEHVAFEGIYYGNDMTAEFKAGTSEATGGTDFETNVAFLSQSNNAVGTIDASGDVVDFSGLENPSNLPLPSAGEYAAWEGLQSASIINQPRTDEEDYGQIDVDFDVDFGAVNSIKTGIRYTDHGVEKNLNKPVLDYDAEAEMIENNSDIFTDGTIVTGFNDEFTIAAPNGDFMIDYTQSFIDEWAQARSGYGKISEENLSAYVMASFEGNAFRGNVGIRYVNTDAESTAYDADPTFTDPNNAFNDGYSTTLVTESHSYNEVLPSVNLNFDLSDDVQLRFSAAEVISRPNYNDMFNSESLLGYADSVDGNEAVVKGTPTLSPFKAFQSDLGLEWYFADGSLASATYFIKEVNTFTTVTTLNDQSIGLVDPGTGRDEWDIQTLRDGDGGTIEGVELQLQHSWDSGFGGLVNYTWADTNANKENFDDENPVFEDSSEHTVNMVAYYESDLFSVQTSYNWRSEYMIREVGFYGNRLHDDFGSLDLNASFFVTDSITIEFDASNLTEEDSIQVGNDQGSPTNPRTSDGYPAYAYQGEARYSLGVSFRY